MPAFRLPAVSPTILRFSAIGHVHPASEDVTRIANLAGVEDANENIVVFHAARRTLTSLTLDPVEPADITITIRRFPRSLAPGEATNSVFEEVAPLIAALTNEQTEWAVRADFEYEPDRSLIDLPVEVDWGDVNKIHGFRLTNESEQPYSLIIELIKDTLYHHTIFESTGALTPRKLREWMARSVKLSNGFVRPRNSKDA